jgi:hypothetical protein
VMPTIYALTIFRYCKARSTKKHLSSDIIDDKVRMTRTCGINSNIDENIVSTLRISIIYSINLVCPFRRNSLVNPSNLSEIVCIVPSTAHFIPT